MIRMMVDPNEGRLPITIAKIGNSVLVSYGLTDAYDLRLAEMKLRKALLAHINRHFIALRDDVAIETNFLTEEGAVEFLKTAGIAEVMEEVVD